MSRESRAVVRSARFGSELIEYEVFPSRRKNVAITVHPDLRVTVACPTDRSADSVGRVVVGKAPWILRQKLRFKDLHPLPTAKRFVSGETLRYLGRQYRLKVVEGKPSHVALERPYLRVIVPDRSDTAMVQRMVERWLRERAEATFARHLESVLKRFPRLGPPPQSVHVRKMQRRWGSCSASGVVTLNPMLVTAHPSCIEYVVAHELCHRQIMKHNPRFYRLLGLVIPDWRDRREKLNEHR